MSKIPKLILVTFINQAFVGLVAILVTKILAPTHLSAFLAYVTRPLFLAATVAIFYTKSLGKVPSFLGFHKKFLRPCLIGMILTVPNGLLLLFLMYWKRLPFTFVPVEAVVHLVFIFLGPGLFEEGLFRGLVFRRLLTMAPWWKAGLYTGGLFAVMHIGNLMIGYPLPKVLFQLGHCLLASLLWGYMTWRLDGNIWGCVAYHTVNNFYGAAFIADQHLLQHLVPYSLLGIVGLTLSFIAAWILLRGKGEQKKEEVLNE